MAPNAETLLVIPTYNEAENLPLLVREVVREKLSLDILVIDDHSPDGTGRIAQGLRSEAPIHVLHRGGKMGIGSAHKEGFQYAIQHGYRRAITMDADFAHSPRYLKQLLEASAFADVVVGSRYIPGGGLAGWSWPRRWLTHTAHWLTTACLGLPYDCTGGFRLYPVSLLKEINLDEIRAEGYAFLIEMLFHIRRRGHTVGQIPIVIGTRHSGKSKISRTEILRAVQTLIRLGLERVSPRVRALFWALLLGYTALHLGYSILRYGVFTGISSGDFNHVYQEAKAWPSENLHPHPPFYYATVLILDRLVGGWQNLIYFFYFLQFLIFPLAIFFLVRAAWGGPPPWTAYALAAALVVNFQPFLETLSLHKVEGIEFFLMCAALLAFRRGRDRLSGGLLMLAANLKYMPALLLVHFGVKREWKVLQGALIGAAAVLAILLLVFGTALISSGFLEQAAGLFIGHRHEGNVAAASVEMQTLSGTVNRWLARPAGGTPFMHYIQVGSYMPVPDPALAYGVAGGLKFLAVAGWLLWLRRRWGAGERQRRWAAHLLEISVSLVMIFVIAQASRVHYSVLALPGFCVVGLLLVQGGRLFSLGEKALFWLAYALTGMLVPGGLLNRLPPDPAWGQMHSLRYLWYSLPFWGLVTLALCAVRMHRRALQER